MTEEPRPSREESTDQSRPRTEGTVRQRRRARSLAVQALYEVDLTGHRPADVLDRLAGEIYADSPVIDYARQLIAGVAQHRTEIDERIARHAPAWPVDQMAAIDRNLLRLGIFEAIYN